MNRADALKKWKKDKPLLLTDTGVSDVLRELPEGWQSTTVDTAEVEKVLKKLKTMMAEDKIKGSKSATACLTAVREAVKKEVARVKENRVKTVEVMTEIHTLCEKHYDMCVGRKISQAKLDSFPGELAKPARVLGAIHSGGSDKGIIPHKLFRDFNTAYDSVLEAARAITNVMEDSTSKTPKFDTAKEMKSSLKEYKEAMDEMPTTCKAVERLS